DHQERAFTPSIPTQVRNASRGVEPVRGRWILRCLGPTGQKEHANQCYRVAHPFFQISTWIFEKSATLPNKPPIWVKRRTRFSRKDASSAITMTLSKNVSTWGFKETIALRAPS